MEYYSLKDALSEGVLLKVRLKCEVSDARVQELLKGRPIEGDCVYLPYYMVECISSTSYVEIVDVLGQEVLEEMEGAPEHVDMEGRLFYSALCKIDGMHPLGPGAKATVKAMHLSRAVSGSAELGGSAVRGVYSREEEAILRKGRLGWRGGKKEEQK
ncbi:uncharacterized protein NEMAJ01_1401 [Nematocida major]|uniref:uncharacterized protein n=1 Tax=Nematocida major TaxID=1912982 RepID=UPI002007C121|nr:uncharacterized protein NEMAJ01_1401 [Nematocida major]KAH9386505.1 hypothetical protein NEMAJ01_1401 [Nematocida major]